MMKTWIAASLFLAAICVGTTSATSAKVTPPEKRIIVGENTTFTCELTKITPDSKFLYWRTPNGTKLPDSDPHTVVTDNGTTLNIINAQLSDEGTYSCVYSDSGATDDRDAVLYVSGKLSISAPSPQYLVIGRPGHLKCTGEGKGIHITEYKWRVNKTKIDPENVAQNGYLTFKKVAKSDEGNYTCIVETVLQDARKTIIVKTVEVSALPKPPSNCTLKPAFSHVDICFQLPKEEVESATEYKIMYWPTDKTDNVTTLYVNKSEFKCPYKISHLEDDTSYTFKVAVANKIAFGADSAVFSAKTNRAKCPRVPTDVQVTPMYTHAMVSWKPPSFDGGVPVTEYRVLYRKNDTDDAFKTVTGTKSPLKVPNLMDNTMYEFKVSARNKRCWGPSVEEVETTKTLAAPDAPTELFLKSTDHSITASWKAPENDHGRPVTEYTLEYRKLGEDDWVKVENVTSPYTISNLKYNREYQVHVFAINAIGMGKPVKSQTKTIIIRAPTAPRNVTVRDIKYDFMMVSWIAPISNEGAAITGYKVEYQMRVGKVVSKVWMAMMTKANALTANLTKLNASTEYNIRVGAMNVAGITYSSPLLMVKTVGAPMAPGLIAFIVIASIIGALIVADVILYFALDTGVTKKVVTAAQTKSGYEKAPEGE